MDGALAAATVLTGCIRETRFADNIRVLSLSRIPGNPVYLVTAWVIVILMLGNVGAMLAAGLGIGTRKRPFYFFAIAVLGVNILLTITDEFGLWDAVTLGIDVVLLVLLIATSSLYLLKLRGQALPPAH